MGYRIEWKDTEKSRRVRSTLARTVNWDLWEDATEWMAHFNVYELTPDGRHEPALWLRFGWFLQQFGEGIKLTFEAADVIIKGVIASVEVSVEPDDG